MVCPFGSHTQQKNSSVLALHLCEDSSSSWVDNYQGLCMWHRSSSEIQVSNYNAQTNPIRATQTPPTSGKWKWIQEKLYCMQEEQNENPEQKWLQFHFSVDAEWKKWNQNIGWKEFWMRENVGSLMKRKLPWQGQVRRCDRPPWSETPLLSNLGSSLSQPSWIRTSQLCLQSKSPQIIEREEERKRQRKTERWNIDKETGTDLGCWEQKLNSLHSHHNDPTSTQTCDNRPSCTPVPQSKEHERNGSRMQSRPCYPCKMTFILAQVQKITFLWHTWSKLQSWEDLPSCWCTE